MTLWFLWLGIKAFSPWSLLGMFNTKIKQQKEYIWVMIEYTEKNMEEYLLEVILRK